METVGADQQAIKAQCVRVPACVHVYRSSGLGLGLGSVGKQKKERERKKARPYCKRMAPASPNEAPHAHSQPYPLDRLGLVAFVLTGGGGGCRQVLCIRSASGRAGRCLFSEALAGQVLRRAGRPPARVARALLSIFKCVPAATVMRSDLSSRRRRRRPRHRHRGGLNSPGPSVSTSSNSIELIEFPVRGRCVARAAGRCHQPGSRPDSGRFDIPAREVKADPKQDRQQGTCCVRLNHCLSFSHWP